MDSLEEQTEQGFYGSPLYKRLGLPEFRSKEEIKEGLKSLAIGPVTGTLGLPFDILDLANLANDLSADYTGNILAKAIQPKLNEIQEKYGRDAFDREFTKLTGIKSDASDVNQMVGELVSLGGLAKAGASSAKVLTKNIKDIADQTKTLLKPKIDKAKDVIQTTFDQTKQAFQPQLATADGIKIPDGTDINKDVVDTSKVESVVSSDSPVGQEAYSRFLQQGFDKVEPTPENMAKAITETGGFISKDGKFRAIIDPTKATFNVKNVDLLEGGTLGDPFYEKAALDINNKAGLKIDIAKFTERIESDSLTIGDLLDYEGLYSQFDQLPPSGKPFINKYTRKPFQPLRDIKVEFISKKDEATQGGHYSYDDVIRITRAEAGRDLGYVRGLLIHELQHAVQHRMGLTSGDNTRAFFKDLNHKKIYEEDLKQANDLGDARGSDISEKIDIGELPDFLTGIDIPNYYSGASGNIYVNDKVIELSEQLNKTYFDIFKEKPFEIMEYSQDINNKIGINARDAGYGKHGVELTNIHIDYLIEALARKINIREDGKLKKLFGDKESVVLDGSPVSANDVEMTYKYVKSADNKPVIKVLNHADQNISSTNLNNYDRQRPELFDQGHKTVDNPLKDIFDITNDNGEFEKHIKDIIFEKPNLVHMYVYGKNSKKGEFADIEDLNDGKGLVLIDSSNTAVVGDVVPNLEKQQELVDFYKNLLEDIKLGNIGKNTVKTDPIFGDTISTPFDRFKKALMDQIDARVALNRTNIKTHKEIADSGIYPTAYANDYGLEVINYTDDEVLKYEKAKDKAFKSYLNKLGEKESKVAQNLKKIEDYPEAIKKEILENEEVLLQEDADKLYGEITGEEPEPSAAVKQTDDMLINMLGDEGIGAEHPNIQEAVNKYVYDVDKSSIEKAIASPDYPSYKADLQRILKKQFPDGKIPVTRILNYASRPDGKKPKKVKSVLDIEDIAFAGNEAERELIANLNGDLTSFSIDNIKKEMNRGGVPTMQKKNIESQQLELFGGMKDQGGTKDPVSGNDVPVGSTKKEVRDDIPAQLSEGEFVLPADVVRYHGLEKIMGLRDQAKQGLNKMEAMGQMGNSDEATLPDDTPFMAQAGGVAGVNVQDPAELTKKDSIFKTRNPYGQQPQMPPPFMPIIDPPTPPKVEAPEQQPRTFEDMMGGVGYGQLQQQVSKLYKNNKTGETRVIPFVNGKPIYPIPAGFVPIEEAGVAAPETGVDTAKVDTTRVTEDKDRDRQTASGATGSFNLGDIDFAGIGLGLINPLLGIGYQALKRQKGDTDFKRGPSFSDRATGKFSGSPASGYFDRPKTNKVGTGVGDTDVNTQGTFNNSFAVDDNESDLHTYGGAKRNEQGHTIYRTINEQVKSLKSAAKTGWFGGPLSAMEYQGLTDDAKKRYNNFAQEFKRLGGDIDGQIYATVDENGNLVNSDIYNEYLNKIETLNVGGSGVAPSDVEDKNGQGGDGYLVSNGKAYKGKYVYSSDGNLQFEKVGGGTIISAGGSGLVGDLTGSGNKTVPLVKKEDEMAGVKEAQEEEQRRKDEAEARRIAEAEKLQQQKEAEAYQKQLEAKAKAAAEAEGKRKKAELAKQIAQAEQRKRDEAEQRRRDEAEANRKERAGITSRGKKVDTASLRGTGRRGGQGIVRAKGGLMTKPTKKNMKRGGLASR